MRGWWGRHKAHVIHLLGLLEWQCPHFFPCINIIITCQKYYYFLEATLLKMRSISRQHISCYSLISPVLRWLFDHSYHTVRKNKTRQSSTDFHHKVMSVCDILTEMLTWAHLSPNLSTNLKNRTTLEAVTSKAGPRGKFLTSASILKVTLTVWQA